MTQTFSRFVAGIPAPQGSKQARPIYRGKGEARVFTGKVAQVESSKKGLDSWRGDVRTALLDHLTGGPVVHFEGPVAVELAFVMKRPVGTPKTRATPAHTKKPDIDKLARGVLDAITSAGVWADDSAVVSLTATKRIAELNEPSGCLIELCEAVAVAPSGERLVIL